MSQFHEHISEELIARYLGDTASAAERELVERWLEAAPANREEFRGYQLIWEHAGNRRKQIQVDTDAAWTKLKAQMQQPGETATSSNASAREIPFQPEKKNRNWFISAAAAVTLLLGVFGWYLLKIKAPENIEVATASETKEQILPDGSRVSLNYNSSISYPEKFEGDTRTVVLTGEAFFEVTPDTEHPFVIQANGAEVKVLGTSFNVKAYEKTPVRVDVATGKVQVAKAGRKVQLQKGEGAEVSADTIMSLRANMNVIGYHTQVYDFNAANLEEVVSSIRDGYHVDVRLGNQKIAQCRLTIRFEKEPLDATLSVIAETLDLNLRKEGKVYWLDGNGCQ